MCGDRKGAITQGRSEDREAAGNRLTRETTAIKEKKYQKKKINFKIIIYKTYNKKKNLPPKGGSQKEKGRALRGTLDDQVVSVFNSLKLFTITPLIRVVLKH